MEMHQLRYFVSAARTGSVSKAASACRVSQPSLSQQIHRLEDGLGVLLFNRVPRGVVLTEAGRALLPRAERILGEVESARVELLDEVEAGVGRFAVGAIPTIAPYLLPGVLASVRNEFDRCEIAVHEDLTEALLDKVADGTLDAAIVSWPIEDDRVEVERVGVERLMVVCPADEPPTRSGTMTLTQLRALPRVSLREMHCLGQQIAGFCVSRGIGAGNVVCHTTQLATVMEMVALGLGVSLVPEMAAAANTDDRLRFTKLSRLNPTREITVATRRGHRPRAIVERLTGFVSAAMRRRAHSR
jgi:DNA-binding transcriptional LysR family regulator